MDTFTASISEEKETLKSKETSFRKNALAFLLFGGFALFAATTYIYGAGVSQDAREARRSLFAFGGKTNADPYSDWVLSPDPGVPCSTVCPEGTCNKGAMELLDSEEKMTFISELLGFECVAMFKQDYETPPSVTMATGNCYFTDKLNPQLDIDCTGVYKSEQNICCCGSNCETS